MAFRVGSVPYVNALPLTWNLEASGVDVCYKVPSALPALLDSGECQAVLASSYAALAQPGRTFASACSVSTFGKVQSVRLFSKVPIHEIGSVALDASSLTSVNLTKIILAESYGLNLDKVRFESYEPNLESMLEFQDACLLIGDIGMVTPANGLYLLDLGQAWAELTQLPFVWALWVGNQDLCPDLVRLLGRAKLQGLLHMTALVEQASRREGWTIESASKYLTEIMDYNLTEKHLEGLWTYRDYLVKHGLIADFDRPHVISTKSVQACVR